MRAAKHNNIFLTAARAFRFLCRWAARGALVVLCLLLAAAGLVRLDSVELRQRSAALGEYRVYRVFNPEGQGAIIYLLDGQQMRNAIVPATIASLFSYLRGVERPTLVAIYSGENRDRDFRPQSVMPTYWRPNIAGRADAFDHFLLNELDPQIGRAAGHPRPRYLMGHSLAGLYALDLASRARGRFEAVFAFSPTFSHDVSVADRLPAACAPDVSLYANWGLESSRDTAIFNQISSRWKGAENCRNSPPIVRHHFGIIHQIVMVTGQIEALSILYE